MAHFARRAEGFETQLAFNHNATADTSSQQKKHHRRLVTFFAMAEPKFPDRRGADIVVAARTSSSATAILVSVPPRSTPTSAGDPVGWPGHNTIGRQSRKSPVIDAVSARAMAL